MMNPTTTMLMAGGVRVSNMTNSTAPEAVNSRVFVGNLNTFVVAKDDLERLFKRYGTIVAISMHKGYAFVQFSNTIEARNSVAGEDGRMIANQILDVNMVSEPKPHQTGRKRHCLLTGAATAATAADWDLYYEGYPLPRIVPPLKRSRIDFLTTVRLQRPKFKGLKSSKCQSPASSNNNNNNASLQSGCVQDTLICGSCRETFTDLQQMVDHKKVPCRLRSCCRCQQVEDFSINNVNHNESLSSHKSLADLSFYTCYICKERFSNAVDMLEHAHSCHGMKIVESQPYEVTDANKDDDHPVEENETSQMMTTEREHDDADEDGVQADVLLNGEYSSDVSKSEQELSMQNEEQSKEEMTHHNPKLNGAQDGHDDGNDDDDDN